MKKTRTWLLLCISMVLVFIIALGISFAYFSARIDGREDESTIVVNGGIMEIYYNEDYHIDMYNIYPKTSPWVTKTFTLTGNNTTDLPMDYKIEIEITENTFTTNSISYELECTSAPSGTVNELSTGYLNETNGTETIGYGTFVNGTGVVHAYTLRIYFKDNGKDQNINQEAVFSGKIKISEAKLIYISYIEDLVDLSNEVNSGDSKEGQFILLTRDLDFNEDDSYRDSTNTTTYGNINGNSAVESIKTELTTGSGFYPIGDTNAHYFRGSFDGQNHRLDNLYINNTKNGIRVGLFGWTIGGKYQNLTVSGNTTDAGNECLGGISGTFSGGAIVNNLHNEVNVTRTNSSSYVGGIAGIVSNAKLINCSNKGTIQNGRQTGGLIGGNWTTATIENSYNEGNVINSKGLYVGGLLGNVYSTSCNTQIYNSYNTGDVTTSVSGTSNTYTGGIVGLVQGGFTMKNSHNEGIVSKTIVDTGSSTEANIGGLIGQISSGIIINSYNIGNISGGNRTGGLVGKKEDSSKTLIINKCYNNGNIVSTHKVSSVATIIGGIGGYLIYGNIYILNSYNTGMVTNYTSGGIYGHSRAKTFIVNSYNTGTISGELVGGIGGYANNGSIYLNNIYNYGNVSGTNKQSIIGTTLTPTINNAYYKSGISSSYGSAKTNVFMASPEFVNLLNQNKRNIDLSTIYSGLVSYELSDWKYDSTKGYPVLDN